MKVTLKNLKGLVSLLSLFVLAVGSLSAQSFTAEERAYIKSAPVISIAYVSGDRAPYSYRTDNGEIEGISVDVMRKISQMSGLQFSHSVLAKGQRTLDYLSEHSDSLVVGVSTENQQFQNASYKVSTAYFTDDLAMVALKNRKFDSIGAESSYTLAIPRGYMALEKYVEEHYPLYHILYASDMASGLDLVLSGHADFYVQNLSAIRTVLPRPQYSRLAIIPSLFADESMGVVGCASPDNRIIISIINKCIAELDTPMMKELALHHIMATTYQMRFADVLYQYRIQLMVVALLVVFSIILLVSFLLQRNRHFRELTEMNTRLMFATEQAHEASLAKSRFLLRISHDLRTPMNAIIGAADYMEMMERRNDCKMEDRLEAISQIRSATLGMEHLVDGVITRADNLEGNLELKNDPFNPGELIAAADNELKMAVSGRVNWVTAAVEPGLQTTVYGDSGKFSELLDALVEWVVCFPHPLRSLILNAKQHRFDECKTFMQVSFSLVTSRPVTDLDEHDTRRRHIENLTDALGGSAVFDLHNEICLDISVTVPFNLSSEWPPIVETAGAETVADLMAFKSPRPLNILVVDDNEVNVLIIQNLLKACGITSKAVYNGREGVHEFEIAPPDTYQAILMDIRMPVMNGNDAIRAIRNSNRTDGKNIPIYAFSANFATSDIAASVNAGCSGYLKKPVDVQKLLGVLESLS